MAEKDWRRWYLVELTPEAAESHDRRVHNCGPDVLLGWKPYTYRATYGAVAQFACHTETQLAVKLGKHHLSLGRWTPWGDGVRTCELHPRIPQ